MVNTLTIAHGEDPDGIISHVFLESHEHILARYDRIGEAFQQAADSDAEIIMVADLNVNSHLIKAGGSEFGLLKKLAEGREVHWYDHHDGTLKHKATLEELGIYIYHSKGKCTSLILAEELHLVDPYDQKLAQIAQASDYKSTSNDKENIELATELEKIISLANESMNEDLLLELTDDLRNGFVFNKGWGLRRPWKFLVNEFSYREEEAYKELKENMEEVKIGKYNVLFSYSSPLLSRQGAFYLRDNYKADVFICLFKAPLRNHMVLKDEKSSFPVVPFACGLGGGGRENGGGFTLDYDITPKNYEAVKEMLVEEVRKYC